MRNFVLLFILSLGLANISFAASVTSITGDLPKTPASTNYFNIEITVTSITNEGYVTGQSNGESYEDSLQVYVGSGDAESDILSTSDDDTETVDFWIEEASDPDVEQQSDESWTIVYNITIRSKSTSSDALDNAISDGTLEIGVEFFMGEKDDGEYYQSTQRFDATLTQAEYAANSRPNFASTAAVGTHKEIVIYYDSPDSISRTDSKTMAPTTMSVIVIPESADTAYQSSGLPGKTYSSTDDDDEDTTCTYQPSNGTSCVDCGTNGYVDVGSLGSDITITSATVSAGSKTITGLTNDENYRVFLQYDPTGIQQSTCVTATPSATVSYTELNGEDDARAEPVRCFIATAAFGSGYHPNVSLFRKFRDDVLKKTPWGQAFIATYYTLSPPLADFIAKHEALRSGAQYLLAAPAAVLDWIYDGDTTFKKEDDIQIIR